MKYDLDFTEEEAQEALSVLRPTGYRVLVAVARASEKMGSLYLPENRRADEDVASILGHVIALGPDAYLDSSRFPGGAFCKKGDTIMMASYTGRRFKIKEREYRLINDDSVIAVVEKPEEVTRA